MIYFDYAATTPIDPAVWQYMSDFATYDGIFANTSSNLHTAGWQASMQLEQIRSSALTELNAPDNQRLLFTSGATESNNLYLQGLVKSYVSNNPDTTFKVISSLAEHKAVLSTLKALACQYPQMQLTLLTPNAYGIITKEQLVDAVEGSDSQVLLVSLMWVNNEIGSINPIEGLSNYLIKKGILFHVDAAQALGKLDVDLARFSDVAFSFSGHKIYGPKGIGALILPATQLNSIEPLMYGGGHEMGLRPGTVANHQVAGFLKALECLREDEIDYSGLRAYLLGALKAEFPTMKINGAMGSDCYVDQIVNVQLEPGSKWIAEDVLKHATVLCLSTGSACNSQETLPSHVLKAIGLSEDEANRSIRISLGRMVDQAQVDLLVAELKQAVSALKS